MSRSTESNSVPASAILSVRSLSVDFRSGQFQAVKSLSFDVKPGKTLAIVGESGSGKSVTSRAIMRLTDFSGGRISGGEILFQSRNGPVDLVTASPDRIRQIRGGEIAMIFQEPMTSLDPVFSIGDQIVEAILLHQKTTRAEANRIARDMLEKVRIPDADAMMKRYPHQLSGGMRQRVMIAMALSCRPKLLIADEPTTALDVTIQAQILNTIRELQRELGMAVIFITHDMGVVAEMADDVIVLRHGEKLEDAPVRALFSNPQHPYTQALLAAVPRLGSMSGKAPPNSEALEAARFDGKLPLLQVDGLTARFAARRSLFGRLTHRIHAVEGISFEIAAGETLALVGESGSGKSTTGRMLQQIMEPTGGKIRFRGRDVAEMDPRDKRSLLQKIQYIFQDPYAALDPRQRVGASIAEPMIVHKLQPDKAAVEARTLALLDRVGLPREYRTRFPHELSGGQRQRVCIARALASDPELIIADESVSALDVSIQAQILDLLLELQRERGLSYLFITHDMAVVEKISHRVAVMYLGQIVEIGTRKEIFENPQHPYTRKLLSAIPVPDPDRNIDTTLLTGAIPSPVRKIGDEPALLQYSRFSSSHFVAAEPQKLSETLP
ncbi:glutathione transport system ATP-binding protein [Rhizobium sp. BK275]|uniref:ABC transporter ATP-binding protein n=1 Tax=Rhizobium sp. BK275 TaxID=2587077 RepID=UPI00161DE721|nr:ABC transporter ATP-binding protein [Rhizobium sp. BK275]MBB3387500.1 glutathione transport system ATP-binding protein [Rhizobium sp. BK275]